MMKSIDNFTDYKKGFQTLPEKRQELGMYIKGIRENKQISLTQLAALTSINVSDLHKIERGTKNKVNPFQLKEISRVLQVDYKVFYRIVDFLEEKDFGSKGELVNEKKYSKEELISILNMYYPKVDLQIILGKITNMKASQMNDILLFIDFIKEKK